MTPLNDYVLSADDIPIYYEVQGDGKPVLVFIHGWCCNRSHWREQLGEFAHQYKVVAVDLAGHGESGRGSVGPIGHRRSRCAAGVDAPIEGR